MNLIHHCENGWNSKSCCLSEELLSQTRTIVLLLKPPSVVQPQRSVIWCFSKPREQLLQGGLSVCLTV